MITTRELLTVLREANPEAHVNEHTIRSALRWGGVPTPAFFAGRFAWTAHQALALARHLGLKLPSELLREAENFGR